MTPTLATVIRLNQSSRDPSIARSATGVIGKQTETVSNYANEAVSTTRPKHRHGHYGARYRIRIGYANRHPAPNPPTRPPTRPSPR